MNAFILLAAIMISQCVLGTPTPRISHFLIKPSMPVSQPQRNFWFKSSPNRSNEFNTFRSQLLSLNDRDEIYRKVVSSFRVLRFSEDHYCKLLQDLDDAKKIFIHISCYKESPWNHTSLVFEATKCDLATIVGFLIKEHKVNLISYDTSTKSLTHYCKSRNVARLILEEEPFLVNARDEKNITPLFTIPTTLIPYFVERGANVDAYASIDFVLGFYHKNNVLQLENDRLKDPENLSTRSSNRYPSSIWEEAYHQSDQIYAGEKLLYTKLTPLMKAVADGDFNRFKVLFDLTSDESLKKQMRSLKLIVDKQKSDGSQNRLDTYKIEKFLKFIDWFCEYSSK